MAKQRGLIHFVGTLDGVNLYLRKGVPVARKAGGGFTRNSIKKSPNMERVRENNSEFGTTSSGKKLFKDGLFPFLGKSKDSVLHGKMMQLFIKIKDCDTFSERGQRNISLGIESVEGQKLLEEFDFTNLTMPFSTGFFDPLSATFSVVNFNTKNLKFPKGASHLKLQLGVLAIDFETRTGPLFVSAPLLIAKGNSVETFSLAVDFPEFYSGTRIAILSYQYVQELNSEFYDLKDKIAYGLKVLKVY